MGRGAENGKSLFTGRAEAVASGEEGPGPRPEPAAGESSGSGVFDRLFFRQPLKRNHHFAAMVLPVLQKAGRPKSLSLCHNHHFTSDRI
jgi:hypothetical protein